MYLTKDTHTQSLAHSKKKEQADKDDKDISPSQEKRERGTTGQANLERGVEADVIKSVGAEWRRT